jgi:hypothetical protein
MRYILVALVLLWVPRPAAAEPPLAPSGRERHHTLDSLASAYAGARQLHIAYLDGDSVAWEVYRNGDVWGARNWMLAEDRWTASVSNGVAVRTRHMDGTVSGDEAGPLPLTTGTKSLNPALRLLSSALAIELKGPLTVITPSRTIAFDVKIAGGEGRKSIRWSMVAGTNLRPSWLDPTASSLLPSGGPPGSLPRARVGIALYDINEKDGWPESVSFERTDGGTEPYLRRGTPSWSPDRWEKEIRTILAPSGPEKKPQASDIILAHSALIEEGLRTLDASDPTLRTRPGDLWLCTRVLALACWGPAVRELGTKDPGLALTPVAVARASLGLNWEKPELERLRGFLFTALDEVLASPLRGR